MRPRLGFVHIPKTAGTSVTNYLQDIYAPEEAFDGITTLDYQVVEPESLEQYRLFKGHMYARDIQKLPRDTILFTVLREPVERAISLYRYHNGLELRDLDDEIVIEGIEIAKKTNIIEYIYSDAPFIIEHIRHGQMRQLISEELLQEIGHRKFLSKALTAAIYRDALVMISKMSYILTTKMIEVTLQFMMDELSLTAPRPVPQDNVSSFVDVGELADIRRALIDVSCIEFQFYEDAKKREVDLIKRRLTISGQGSNTQEPPSV